MNYLVRFWVTTLSVVTAVAALGYLFLSFVFPDVASLGMGTAQRLGVAVVGVAATGILVWTVTTFDVGGNGKPPEPGSRR